MEYNLNSSWNVTQAEDGLHLQLLPFIVVGSQILVISVLFMGPN